MRRRGRIRLVLLALVALLAVAIGIAFRAGHVLRSLELSSVDARFSVRGDEKPPGDLVVVGIDSETLQNLNEQFPFPRNFHARVLKNLKKDGARVIAVDIAFSQPSKEKPRFCDFAGAKLAPDDCALLEATYSTGNVVYSAVDVDPRNQAIPLFGETATPDVLKQLRARAGFSGIVDDPDGSHR